MTDRHRVLIVEDDRSTAEDLAEFARALNCDPVMVDNKRDALAAFERDEICLVLLDLQIKREPNALKGHFEAGNSLLREIRALHSEHEDNSYRLPIIVVSACTGERGTLIEIMKNGANDVIDKPLDRSDVSRRVRQCLERSGRTHHDSCHSISTRRLTSSGALILSIPGDVNGRRTRVVLGGRDIPLTDSNLRTLLHLVVGRLRGTMVHKTDLGTRNDEGCKSISNLRNALKPAIQSGTDIVGNDHAGSYWLKDNVAIGDCDVEKLCSTGNATITKLAEKLRSKKL